jgi:copper transport protein
VQGEVVLAAVALGLTAALVGMVPAGTGGSGVFSADHDDAAGSVSVTVSPARAGANTMHIFFSDVDGRPRTVDVAEATVAIGDVPARRIELSPITRGHFSAYGFSLPDEGDWTVTITSVTRGVVATTSFEVPVR